MKNNEIKEKIKIMKIFLILPALSPLIIFSAFWFSIRNLVVLNFFGFLIDIIWIIVLIDFIGFIIFFFKFWRCPNCKNFIGRDINKKICDSCGVELQ